MNDSRSDEGRRVRVKSCLHRRALKGLEHHDTRGSDMIMYYPAWMSIAEMTRLYRGQDSGIAFAMENAK